MVTAISTVSTGFYAQLRWDSEKLFQAIFRHPQVEAHLHVFGVERHAFGQDLPCLLSQANPLTVTSIFDTQFSQANTS